MKPRFLITAVAGLAVVAACAVPTVANAATGSFGPAASSSSAAASIAAPQVAQIQRGAEFVDITTNTQAAGTLTIADASGKVLATKQVQAYASTWSSIDVGSAAAKLTVTLSTGAGKSAPTTVDIPSSADMTPTVTAQSRTSDSAVLAITAGASGQLVVKSHGRIVTTDDYAGGNSTKLVTVPLGSSGFVGSAPSTFSVTLGHGNITGNATSVTVLDASDPGWGAGGGTTDPEQPGDGSGGTTTPVTPGGGGAGTTDPVDSAAPAAPDVRLSYRGADSVTLYAVPASAGEFTVTENGKQVAEATIAVPQGPMGIDVPVGAAATSLQVTFTTTTGTSAPKTVDIPVFSDPYAPVAPVTPTNPGDPGDQGSGQDQGSDFVAAKVTSSTKYTPGQKFTLKGKATPGASITVDIPGNSLHFSTTVNANGVWKVKVPALDGSAFLGNTITQVTTDLRDVTHFDLTSN
ncbi:hypothetical protein [Curtobacterium sp. MCBA15_008]|uniref:hypothetical protein n=1 Tax=Curtobacterium sp. MCBA15_008 TaxID=1898736 RepID=UPI0008DE1269|nr:hypothetical protein [Curtobacterium sp. MCBA15_008]OII09016.1 hypothetical protein BIU96_03685 [Curtobacterium sp. MCBA15_008]